MPVLRTLQAYHAGALAFIQVLCDNMEKLQEYTLTDFLSRTRCNLVKSLRFDLDIELKNADETVESCVEKLKPHEQMDVNTEEVSLKVTGFSGEQRQKLMTAVVRVISASSNEEFQTVLTDMVNQVVSSNWHI